MSKKLFFAGELIDTANLNSQQTIKTVEIQHEMTKPSPFIYTSKYYCSIEVVSDNEYRLIGSHCEGVLCRWAPPYVPFRDAKIFLDVENPDWDEVWHPHYRNYLEALTIEDFTEKYIAAASKAGATPITSINIEIERNLTVLTLKF